MAPGTCWSAAAVTLDYWKPAPFKVALPTGADVDGTGSPILGQLEWEQSEARAWLHAVIRALHAETKCRSTERLRIQRQLTSDLSRFVRILHPRSASNLIVHHHCVRRAEDIVDNGFTKRRIAALDLPEPKFPRRKARKRKGRPSSSGGAASARSARQSATNIMRCTGHVTCCPQAVINLFVQQHLTGEGDLRATLDVQRVKRRANVKSPHSRPARRQAIWRRAVAAKKCTEHCRQCGCRGQRSSHYTALLRNMTWKHGNAAASSAGRSSLQLTDHAVTWHLGQHATQIA